MGGSDTLKTGLLVIEQGPHATILRPQTADIPRLSVNAFSVDRPVRVLLVEDDPGDARLVWEALQSSDEARFKVTHVRSIADAKTQLETPGWDAVLLDLTLPDSAGIGTLGKIQAVARSLPIVVMTGLSDPKLANYALEVGAQDFLVKGDVSSGMVARAIRYAIARMKTQQAFQSLVTMLEAERSRMQQEIDAARSMQFALLPRPDRLRPRLDHLGLMVETYFEPSSGIGGDLWSSLDCGDNAIGFLAFDFSGHGVQAALNAFRLHALIHDHSHLASDPAELLTALNVAMKPLLPTGQYATVFYGIIDCAANELRWAAGGWPPPLHFSGDAPPVALDTRGLPLGISTKAFYETSTIPFGLNDQLVLYSDALPETCDSEGTMLDQTGTVELADRCRGAAIGSRLQALLDGFFARNTVGVDDDLTILWISRSRPPGQ
ncbi:Stage II sporulation E [Magnetospirillum sp. LM-5]|nr:Stage II sporulation E [Magnetospirillum sp. LM-5]